MFDPTRYWDETPYSTWPTYRECPPPPERVTDYIVGLDLAQAQDPTALAVVERTFKPRLGTISYACRELRRWPLGTPYTEIVADLGAMVCRSAACANVVPLSNAPVIVDATGVGLAVVDMVARLPAMSDRLARVVVTAGQAAGYDRGAESWQVPRKELVGVLQMLLQTNRLTIAGGLSDARTLVEELQNFKARVGTSSTDALEHWRERKHDDLVLALAIPLWHAEQNPPHLWTADEVFAVGGMDPFGR